MLHLEFVFLEQQSICDRSPRRISEVPLLAIVVPGKGKEEEESLFTAKPVFPEFVLQSKSKFHDAFKVLCGYIINLVGHCLYHYKVTSFPFHLLVGREQTFLC